MIIRALFLLLTLCIAPAAWADDVVAPAAPDGVDAKNYEVAQELVKSFDMKNLLQGVLRVMSKTMVPLINQSNPGQGDKIEKIVTTAVEKNLAAHMDEMNNHKAAIYAQMFTYDELTQLRDFYASPVGQKMIKQTPEMMKRSAAMDQDIMMSAIRDASKDVADELKKSGMKVPKELGV